MGNELARADLLDPSLSDREYFERFFLLFSDKLDSYRDYDMTVYQYVIKNLDVLLCLGRHGRETGFIENCMESQGDYYTVEIFSRLVDLYDLVEWLCHEYCIQPCTVNPLLLQHPVFYVQPDIEIILKNLERIVRWYKRYNTILLSIHEEADSFAQKFFFSYFCDSLAEKVKLITL